MSKQQVKSRQRVADHGEVFTVEREVNAMLDLVKQHATVRNGMEAADGANSGANDENGANSGANEAQNIELPPMKMRPESIS